jgi:hypothetical protein
MKVTFSGGCKTERARNGLAAVFSRGLPRTKPNSLALTLAVENSDIPSHANPSHDSLSEVPERSEEAVVIAIATLTFVAWRKTSSEI